LLIHGRRARSASVCSAANSSNCALLQQLFFEHGDLFFEWISGPWQTRFFQQWKSIEFYRQDKASLYQRTYNSPVIFEDPLGNQFPSLSKRTGWGSLPNTKLWR